VDFTVGRAFTTCVRWCGGIVLRCIRRWATVWNRLAPG
jgi:hypothetical protein